MNQVAIPVLIIVLLNAVNIYGQTNNVCSNNEEVAALEIQLDQNADEIGYNLVCDDETIWDVPVGALKEQPAGAWKIERSCIRSDIAICNFTISDDGQDGITGGEFGFFSLSYGATTVAYFDYGKSAPFTEQSYCFGTDCDSPMLEKKEEDEAIKGWKIVDFNETEVPKSDSSEPEEDESDFNVSGVWVVNVTNIKNGDSDRDQDDNGKWVVNVTVIEKEDDPSIDNDVEPNDAPQPNENATNKSDSYSHSASSLTIIACVIGSILIVMIVAFFLHKRGLCGRATTHDTIGAVLPVHNKNGKHNNSNDDSDDERSKSSHHNDKVQQAETFVTYDSADSTVRRTV